MNILNQINENEYLKIKVKDLENDLAKEQNKAQYFKKAQKRIEELEYKLLIVEKALELACEDIRFLSKHTKYNLMSEEFVKQREERLKNLENDFITKAKEMMKSE